MQISKENFVSTRNFSNKIWNATRFALMHVAPLGGTIPAIDAASPGLDLPDRWILNRFFISSRS